MPTAGSQVILCDIPVRFDTYNGCSHACSYCFVKKNVDIANIKLGESVDALKKWINGKRDLTTNWCDWDIPLHWGGVSDPFQPAERIHKRSLECLKVFAETQYPFVFSTKSSLIAEEPYLSLIKKCNCVVQISAASSLYDKLEPGASSYAQRMEAAKKIAPHKRVIIRIQPYVPNIFSEVIKSIRKYSELGVYGIVIEGMKYNRTKIQGLVRMGNDLCYPVSVLKPQFQAIKDICHKYGLKFYCGENRLRNMGDSLCCCGVDGLGWKVNNFNLNHYLFDTDNFTPTDRMKEIGTAGAFAAIEQTTVGQMGIKKSSFAQKIIQAAERPYPYQEQPMFTQKQAEILRAYLCEAKKKAGLKSKDIDKHLGTYMGRHYFGASQWSFPTEEAYKKLQQIMPLEDYHTLLKRVGFKR